VTSGEASVRLPCHPWELLKPVLEKVARRDEGVRALWFRECMFK
jgi:hypothetical protein